MEQHRLYRTLFLMDDTRNYTNDFYISEFVKIVLYNEGCFTLTLSELHDKIVDLTSLEYTEEDILHALSIWNNGEVDVENGSYSLSSLGAERISNRKRTTDIRKYIDLFLQENRDKYSATKDDVEDLLEKFIYQRFNENLKEISDILNHCLNVGDFDKKYSDEEKEIINDFLAWNNSEKNECIYRLIAKAYDYCMINSKCQAQEVVFSKIHFYLDTNIIFRLMGINGLERESSVKSLIEKCEAAGIKIIVSNFVIEECEYTINSQIDVLVESTARMEKLMPPSTMSFAEEKSIRLDFYRRYYDWVKAGNKHRNYDGFKRYIINEFKELLKSFVTDNENKSFKVIDATNFKFYYDSLYNSKMDKHTTETDINSFMLVLEKRRDAVGGNEFFLISADQRLISWSREVFPGQKSIVDFPSVWLSIILKYIGREKESDYKAFCQFIHLSIEPKIEDLERKIAIKASIMSTDIDDEIKARMIDEVRDNYSQYKDYEPDRVMHVAYAKAKESIEVEVERRKNVEFEERFSAVQKDFEEQFSRQEKAFMEIVDSSKRDAVDAYVRGRMDFMNEQKEQQMNVKIDKILKRNQKLRNIIKFAAYLLVAITLLVWVLAWLFGLLESNSPFVQFYKENSFFIGGLTTIVTIGESIFALTFNKDKYLSIDKEVISKKVHEKHERLI